MIIRKIKNFYRDSQPIVEVAKQYGIKERAVRFQCLVNIYIRHSNLEWYRFLSKYRYGKAYLKAFLSPKMVKKIFLQYNPSQEEINILNDKFKCNELFKKYINRAYLNMEEVSKEDVEKFLLTYNKAILKPCDSQCGIGVEVVSKIDEVLPYLGKPYVLEEVVVNHPDLKKLSSDSLNTIRIYTVKEKDHVIRALSSSIRIGAKGNIVDNAHFGSEVLPVDITTGICYPKSVNILGEEKDTNYHCHEKYVGMKIPHWDKVINACLECAKLFKHQRLIGWDVAVTKDGIEMIEANSKPHLHLFELTNGPSKAYFLKHWNLDSIK